MKKLLKKTRNKVITGTMFGDLLFGFYIGLISIGVFLIILFG